LANRNTGLILAAGNSSRAETDKQFADIYGKPALLYSLIAFEKAETIDDIIIVTNEDKISEVKRLCLSNVILKMKNIIAGGANRTVSARLGTEGLQNGIVAIHDGARPLITPEDIDRTVRAADKYRAAILAAPVRDTIKIVAKPDDAGVVPLPEDEKIVRLTPDRRVLYAAQTPQAFDVRLYREASAALPQTEEKFITDDGSILERYGISPYIVEGGNFNIKITYPEDLMIAELFARVREN